MAVNRENFGTSILPHILLLNRLEQWKSPKELCVNTPNIAEQYILDKEQKEIIQGYLDEVSRKKENRISFSGGDNDNEEECIKKNKLYLNKFYRFL